MTTVTRVRLWWHERRHPKHVIVGWDGTPLACGTCLGLPNPENGLPRQRLPRQHPDFREEWRS